MIAPGREQFLQRLALFSDLDAGEFRELAEVAQVVQFPALALIVTLVGQSDFFVLVSIRHVGSA
jgi:hypothetical protein